MQGGYGIRSMPTTIEMANILQSGSIVKLGFDFERVKR